MDNKYGLTVGVSTYTLSLPYYNAYGHQTSQSGDIPLYLFIYLFIYLIHYLNSITRSYETNLYQASIKNDILK